MNLCRTCGHDFASVRAFDAHRIGRHAYTQAEGLALDPPRKDGRRCLSADRDARRRLGARPRGDAGCILRHCATGPRRGPIRLLAAANR